MIEQNSGYWKYNVYNVFDTLSLSSYALEQTPLKFIPTKFEYDEYSDFYIIWNFGDGSPVYQGLSASNSFFYPGEYNVTMTVMVSSGNTELNSFNQKVTIYDFIPNTFSFKQLSGVNSKSLFLTAGVYSEQLSIERFNSIQSYGNPYTFFLNASGSNSLFYDRNKLLTEPYSFLLPTHRFVKREKIGKYFSDLVIDEITTTDTNLYGKLDETSLVVPTSSDDVNSFFVGTSGVESFYFVDDFVNENPYFLLATSSTVNYPDNYTKNYNIDYKFNLPIKNSNTSYYKISSNAFKKADYFSITSNGLDGQGFDLPTFNIGTTKFINQMISFVVKCKYSNLYDCKNQINTFTFDTSPWIRNGVQIFLISPSNNNNLGDITEYVTIDKSTYENYQYGWLKGNIIIPPINTLNSVLSSNTLVALSAKGELLDNEGFTYFISGSSSPFRLFDINYNKIAKINENFDSANYLKGLSYQPSIYKRPEIFDTFFGTTLGTLSSNVDAIGKRTYEKTSNFVKNTVNIDTCDIQALFGFASEFNVDLNSYASKNLVINYPPEVSRLVNLFSIKKSLLFGKVNQYNFDFKNTYNLNQPFNNIYESANYLTEGKSGGVNLGPQIDILSGIINKESNYIVGYEQFSDSYTLLRTNIEHIKTSTYPLSSLDKNWGWGLVVPDSFYTESLSTYKLSNYYTFFEYIPVVQGNIVNNIINWNDTYNTTLNIYPNNLSATHTSAYLSSYRFTPLETWDSTGGVIDQNLTRQINLGLELLSSYNLV